jgi:hypothetical protein
MKKLMQIIPADKVNMGGHYLDQPLPTDGLNQVDPFLLIHHWKDELPAGLRPQEVGVGPHPHRGFSPVTFVYKGSVEHRDSLGNRAVVSEGGTQWMDAGRGITHSERPSLDFVKTGGEQEFIQFWINSPPHAKTNQPFYLPLSGSDTPEFKADGLTLAVVSGEYQNIKGPAPSHTPMLLLRGDAEKGTKKKIDIPTGFNTIIYVLDGVIKLNNETVSAREMGVFSLEGEVINLEAMSDAKFIVLAGEPINEPVVSYGPFVMNTQSEIMETLRDSKMGKMGILIEDFD